MTVTKYANRKGEHCRHGFIGTCPLQDECNVPSDRPALTDAGRVWAENASADAVPSMVAVVALTGDDNGWPQAHVDTAIEMSNRLAQVVPNSQEGDNA